MLNKIILILLLKGCSSLSMAQIKDTIYFEKKNYLDPSKSETVAVYPTDTSYLIINILNINTPSIKLKNDWYDLQNCSRLGSFINENKKNILNGKIVVLGKKDLKYPYFKCVIDAFKENDILVFYLGETK